MEYDRGRGGPRGKRGSQGNANRGRGYRGRGGHGNFERPGEPLRDSASGGYPNTNPMFHPEQSFGQESYLSYLPENMSRPPPSHFPGGAPPNFREPPVNIPPDPRNRFQQYPPPLFPSHPQDNTPPQQDRRFPNAPYPPQGGDIHQPMYNGPPMNFTQNTARGGRFNDDNRQTPRGQHRDGRSRDNRHNFGNQRRKGGSGNQNRMQPRDAFLGNSNNSLYSNPEGRNPGYSTSEQFEQREPYLNLGQNESLSGSTTCLNSDVPRGAPNATKRPKKRNRKPSRKGSETGVEENVSSGMQPQDPTLGNSNTSVYSNSADYKPAADERPSENNQTENNTSATKQNKKQRNNQEQKPNNNKTNANEGKKQNKNKKTNSTDGGNGRTALSMDYLENLVKKEPLEIVQLLSGKDNPGLFEDEYEPKMFVLVLEVLRLVCACEFSNEVVEILRQASLPEFLNQIFKFVCEYPYTEDEELLKNVDTFFENILSIYGTFSDFRPGAEQIWRTHLLEVQKSMKAVIKNKNFHLNPNLLSKLKSLLDDVGIEKDEPVETSGENVQKPVLKKKEVYFPDPVGDFRTVPLYPRPEDVFGEQPFLNPNVVEGPFRSVDQYLDIHFKLLREDFMGPIRQALRNYKRRLNTKDQFKRIENVRIYRKTKFLTPKTLFDKVGYEVCFDVDKKLTRVNWEFCSRFLFGSLLLFTEDQFDTFFLATVGNRNIKDLENKKVFIELIGPAPSVTSLLGKEFIMAESEAYFEPYFHVLKALQMFNNTNFPLARYIVGVHTETGPPQYLSPDDWFTIRATDNEVTFKALSDEEWPTNNELGLDTSQYEAYKAALTNDMVVIQGPPGTGKTFLGLKIATALLKNHRVWNPNGNCPILVVCFTNHALDQFLEGLLPFTNRLVRIGGKSKGSELDKFNMRERRKEYSYYRKTQTREMRDLNLRMSRVFAEVQVYQKNLQILDDSDGIISLKTLELVLPDNQKGYFRDDDYLVEWLLCGMGSAKNEKKVKVTITADRGVVKETVMPDPATADIEDQRFKQSFFDHIEFDKSVSPSEHTIIVHQACNLNAIKMRRDAILNEMGNSRKNSRYQMVRMKEDSNNLTFILKYLTKELIEARQYPRSDFEEAQLLQENYLDQLQPGQRWKLYNTWVDTLKKGLMVELGTKETQFKEISFRYEQVKQTDDTQILKTSDVVGTTTTIAARMQPVFTALAPKIVIVEEAAEVLEAHIIASLTKSCEHLILIGDHKQLRPNIADVRLARQYKLDISLFERMVINGLACHTLTLQHRMRPEISKQLVPTIYPTLLDDISVHEREHIKGMEKSVYFMTHKNFEDEVVEITSKRNQFEAEILLRLAKYLVLQGYKPSEITILGTYKGQMYHMKNESRKIEDFPKGIQITLVDNFQGEENKIILLSLVRSNAVNKIGFLEIENRVCVALSRARDGLYIIGNMDCLVASSEIWPRIKTSLVEQGAFGTSLPLRCEIHPTNLTKITCAKDFSKVSEGGCNLLCGQPLRCGHACKSMCHISQDYHKRYKCKEPCPRILCKDEHKCPKKCHENCGECQIPMRRDLPCGHIANVPCYLDIRLYKCKVEVNARVPLCGHSVTILCHQKDEPKCNLPCDIRMECGHSCDKLCHVDEDPDHLEYPCLKPCPRLNKGCSGDHKCKLACFEECKPCEFSLQRELLCGHFEKLLCNTDLGTVQCKRKCERTLSCGHPCTRKCYEPCADCLVIVEKKVRDCGHTVKIACSVQATILLCDGPCISVLPCGHQCAKRCRDTCRPAHCIHPKRHKMPTLLCGHTNVSVPCNKTASVRSMPDEELMQYCCDPCGKELPCKHICSGSCSECMQGRIHKVCDQPCGNVLICGHSCRVPCREVCPPCDQPCSFRCKHSKCNRKCGQVCMPCNEKCDYACKHLKCSKKCGEMCDRKPCYEPCPLLLHPCNHPCVGFCGEPCPPCRVCNAEYFTEFFYTGEETEPDAKWVLLEDCNHTFESSGLEYWLNMKQESGEIISKACPRCKTPIISVQRFMNIVKATHRDIQLVKERVYGKIDELSRLRLQSLKKLRDIHFVVMNLPGGEPDELEGLYKRLLQELPEVKMKKRNAMHAQKVQLLCFLTEYFVILYESKLKAWIDLSGSAKVTVTKKINTLTQLLNKREMKISENEMKSFELELKRIIRLIDLLTYTSSMEYRMLPSMSIGRLKKREAEKIINSIVVFDDKQDEKIKLLLTEIKKVIGSSTEITSAERAMINKAMKDSFHSSQKTGHWFKCKNGHMYCITECGGAMVEAECPIRGCGARIGGQNHTLLKDQTLASEMDGARFAAWSDQNNMANFGFQF